jgi:hypothetical protein
MPIRSPESVSPGCCSLCPVIVCFQVATVLSVSAPGSSGLLGSWRVLVQMSLPRCFLCVCLAPRGPCWVQAGWFRVLVGLLFSYLSVLFFCFCWAGYRPLCSCLWRRCVDYLFFSMHCLLGLGLYATS